MSHDELIKIEPAKRVRESCGDYVTDTIHGILIAFAYKLQERDNWLDLITVKDAEREIKQLIQDER